MSKHPAILLFLTCFLSGLSYGQNNGESLFDGERKFLGGLVAGANLNQIDGDAYYGYNKVGIAAGGIVYWNLVSKIGASLELLYSQKGAKGIDEAYSSYVGPYFGKYNLTLNYVEVPLVIHYYITPKYHLGVGASYARLIRSAERYDGVNTYIFPPDAYPFLKSNIDFIASASMMVWRGFMINVRYQYSITPIRYPEYVPQGLGYNFERQMNNLFSIRALYLF